jgi:hypothetical protein
MLMQGEGMARARIEFPVSLSFTRFIRAVGHMGRSIRSTSCFWSFVLCAYLIIFPTPPSLMPQLPTL